MNYNYNRLFGGYKSATESTQSTVPLNLVSVIQNMFEVSQKEAVAYLEDDVVRSEVEKLVKGYFPN